MAGIAGYGRCAEIEIEVLSPDEDDAWELQLATASADFRFAIAGPETITEMVRFMESDGAGCRELRLGSMDRMSVVLVSDRAGGPARFWFKVRGDRGFLALAFADDEARKLVAAVRDAHADLARTAG